MVVTAVEPSDRRSRLARSFSRLSTGIKMFLVITLALLPLGLIALLASLQASRTADQQHRANLNVASIEVARTLAVVLNADVAQARAAASMIASGGEASEACRRANAALNARAERPIGIALFGPDTPRLCATRGFEPARPPRLLLDARPEARLLDDAIDIVIPSQSGAAVAVLRYPVDTLASYARPTGYAGRYRIALAQASDELLLSDTRSAAIMQRVETASEPLGLLNLSLDMTVERVAFNATEALLTFLPLLMWASAAMIGFLVVDRLLIRPLRTLRTSVAGYVPGQPFVPPTFNTPALEIRALGETFERFADDLADHEAQLARSFADQVLLTREVHHRVKNNLQVIASLISLHARAAGSREAATAYASIQRRVDAMSIVHRNHYAESDPSRGIPLKTLLSELAASLRASVGPDTTSPAISVATPVLPVAQDSAIPIAFIVTELSELSMLIDAGAAIAITVEPVAEPDRARLRVDSTALQAKDDIASHGGERYRRIVEALARQLRAPLEHDGERGYAIVFPTGAGKSVAKSG